MIGGWLSVRTDYFAALPDLASPLKRGLSQPRRTIIHTVGKTRTMGGSRRRPKSLAEDPRYEQGFLHAASMQGQGRLREGDLSLPRQRIRNDAS